MIDNDFTFFFKYFRIDVKNQGLKIELENSNIFQHEDLENARSEIFYEIDYQKIDSQNDDIIVSTFYNNDGGKIVEVMIFSNGNWEHLINSEILDNNYYSLIFESEKFNFEIAEHKSQIRTTTLKVKVTTWDEIVDNFRAFKEIDKNELSQALKKYSQFSHWYYFPEEEIFAPSKFLGYKNSTIENYDSSGTGGDTQIALSKFFKILDRNSEEFKRLYRELEQISKNNLGKNLSYNVLNGKGGIYIPKI